MRTNKIITRASIFILLYLSVLLVSCGKIDNPVFWYFQNAELQYEDKVQEENIATALNDILNLSEEQLKAKRYKDYAGKEKNWDLPTLIHRHFVPDKKGASLGNDFYHDVKSEEVQKEIKKILERVKGSIRK